MNVYRSSPPLPGIYRPSFLIPSAHAQPLPNSEDSSEIEGFSSDDEANNVEVGEAAGDGAGDDGREHSHSPSGDAQAKQAKGARSVVRKHHSSAQSTSNR